MADIGVGRVSWYGRDASLGKIVDLYKKHKGGKDTYSSVLIAAGQDSAKSVYRQVPHLIWHPDRGKIESWEMCKRCVRLRQDFALIELPPDADQDAWYQDCVFRNAQSSDFILVLDTDEFPMVNWHSAKPLDQFKTFMRNLHPSVGSIEFDRLGLARPSELGPPKKDEMVQTQFE